MSSTDPENAVTRLRLVRTFLTLLPAIVFLVAFLPLHMLARKAKIVAISDRLPLTFHRILLWLLDVRVIVRGRPEPTRPLLICSNHVSWLDIPVLGSIQPVSFISKDEVAGWPVIGFLARQQDTIFIDRTRRHATGEATQAMADALSEDRALVLFPEGTSSDGRAVLPFMSSLIGAVQKEIVNEGEAGARIQPVVVCYQRRDGLPITRGDRPDIGWYGDMDLLPHAVGIALGGPLEVVIDFLPPLDEDLAGRRKEAASVMQRDVQRRLALRLAGRWSDNEPSA
ncbi:MAG: 1-acyl-sn-glycerol-3-phosphate acyltransferase [Hyphomicrobiaceae bacterium]|nr:1-acyl-sn-glycerol-3-phosphate acyltransferase [Hyphomicrobiaceae bacterium]